MIFPLKPPFRRDFPWPGYVKPPDGTRGYLLGSQLSHGDDFSAASGESSTFPGAKDSEGWHRMASGLGDIPLILIDHIYRYISDIL